MIHCMAANVAHTDGHGIGQNNRAPSKELANRNVFSDPTGDGGSLILTEKLMENMI